MQASQCIGLLFMPGFSNNLSFIETPVCRHPGKLEHHQARTFGDKLSAQGEVEGMRGAHKDSNKLSFCPVSDRMQLAMVTECNLSPLPSLVILIQLCMLHWLYT